MNPLISIVIPTFNRVHYLKQAIMSIQKQTYGNIQILVIDDNSEDETRQMVFGLNDKRIAYLNNGSVKNVSTLRNIGIHHSNGDLIGFCDDDDLWEPWKLEKNLKVLQKYDLVCSNAIEINNTGEIERSHYFDTTYSFQISLEQLLYNNFVITSSVLIKKDAINNLGRFNDKKKSSAEDYDLWLRAAEKYQLFYDNTPLIQYRKHDNLTNRPYNYPILIKNSIQSINRYVHFNDKAIAKAASLATYKFRKHLYYYYKKNKKYFKASMVLFKIIICNFYSVINDMIIQKWR
jgi:glycosyltransferase involved in cell wall biosynthesis